MKTATILVSVLLFSVLALLAPSAVLADQGQAAPDGDQVLNSLNRIYGTGPISVGESTSTGVPMDPAGDIKPPAETMAWSEYVDAIEALNDQLDKGTITIDEHFESFQNLYQSFNGPRRLDNRMIQAARGESRPVDAGDIDTSIGRRPAKNPAPVHDC